jgi:tetratricopeptide (TPR) repeat protein
MSSPREIRRGRLACPGAARVAPTLIAAFLALFAACGRDEPSSPPTTDPGAFAPETAQLVGGAVCASCHAAETERWQSSHHDRAMQLADETTVLGDFDEATLEHYGVRTSFLRRDDRFVVRSDGPEGALEEYEVAYTFGVEPLQQYLIRFPDGRVQALGIAWDSRPAAVGGQRWFHLHADEPVPHDDVLHWTAPSQSWNSMCAECHSTGLQKGYRASERRFETTWSEIDVSCEACHGPGSAHVRWAEQGADRAQADLGLGVSLRNDASWSFDGETPIARRQPPGRERGEIESCAPCHARRSTIAAGFVPGQPLLDFYRPALIDAGLYHADGQILDEVYVYGSFLQSRMYAAGVTCSDCHDPHALRIEDPEATCARCHRPEVYATAAHHHHMPGSPAASCVSCHMPARTYMGVDDRHDHGLRVPRPDLSLRLGVPNACNDCHAEHDAGWAATWVAGWFPDGRTGQPHWAEALHAGREGFPGAGASLLEWAERPEVPVIVRASALRLLGASLAPDTLPRVQRALGDPEPLVRMAALEALEALPPARRLVASPLLRDPVRAVRIDAARLLAASPPELWVPGDRVALADALAEYREAQLVNAERPEARVNLGLLHIGLGELEQARREYELALELSPHFVPAYVNLADLHRAQKRDDLGEPLLRRALETAPESVETQHALGLLLIRQQRIDEALEPLARAAELAPGQPHYAWVQALALDEAGREGRAVEVLERAHERHPRDGRLLLALADLQRERGEAAAALRAAQRLVELEPENPAARALLRELESATAP